MEERIKDFVKTSKSIQNAVKAVETFWKDRARGNAPAETESAEKAVRLLDAVAGIESAAAAVRASIAGAMVESRQRMDRERALLAGAVAKKLGEGGLKVTGNLPTLFAGFFSLEFTFGTKGLCTIWMGPGKYRLGTAPLDPDSIATLVLFLNDRLFPAAFDEHAFLADLEMAYRIAVVRAKSTYGKAVPLADIVPEMAFLRQKATFLIDPRKESFITWGRVEFAAELSRLRTRTIGDWELRLDVATMSQTRKAGDHLWVPRPGSIEGMNFATIRFLKVAQ